MTYTPPDLPLLSERLRVAVPIAMVYGLLLYMLIWLTPISDMMPFFGGLMLLPMGIASLASSISDPRAQKALWNHVKMAWMIIGGLVVISMVFFREGGICVIMAAPFFAVFSAIGSWVTLSLIRRFRSPRSTMLVIALPLMVYPLEPLLKYEPHEGAVTTVIDIAASPDIVWQQTAEIRNVRADELSWTFSHGIVGVPQPVDARLEGEGVGAVRQLEWTRGVKFQEIITQWEENRLLAWDFNFGPESIPAAVEAHIDVDSSYLKLTNGDYQLETLPNGHTRLTLTTRYRIATPINFYCDFWGKVFLNDFHGVVLKVIRDRSQRIAAAA
ncbi:SRPBCC family protein [Brucella pseudogrignonensis]|uniref:SRPBCC family protein n=1 Tax=Brucella pseudogrignonensis TaxID=419475 RepID=UPI0028B858F7|nr:SRPBCC family protein [Brucella pseudogrignonensis]MDT6939393.1 SRPBCC family protein [Brucella pseudogrignonensis]